MPTALFATTLFLFLTGNSPAPRAQTSLAEKAFVAEAPRPIPSLSFQTRNGSWETWDHWRIKSPKGRWTLLHLWITSCAPCLQELVDLDGLAGHIEAEGFTILPLSQDTAGEAAVRGFYRRHGIKNLGLYVDAEKNASRLLRLSGIPTTLLLDPSGQERGRFVGAVDWKSKDTLAFLKKQASD